MKNGLCMDISNSGGRIQLKTLREKHLDTLNSYSSRVGLHNSRPHSHIDSKVKSKKREIVESFSGGYATKQYYLRAKNATARIDCTQPKTLGRKEFISKFKFQENRHDEVERTHIRGMNHIVETVAGLQQELKNHRVTLQQKSQLNQTYLAQVNEQKMIKSAQENSQTGSMFSQSSSSRRNQTYMSLFQNSSQESSLQSSRNSRMLQAQDSVIIGCQSPLLSPTLSSFGDSPTTRPIFQLSRSISGIDSYRPQSAQTTNSSNKETFLLSRTIQPTQANEYWGGRDFERIKKKNCYLEQCKRTDVNYDVFGTMILKEINRILKKISSSKQLGCNGKLPVYDLAVNNGYEGLKRYMLNIVVEHQLFSSISLQALAKILHNQQPHLDKMKLILAAQTLEKELLRNSSSQINSNMVYQQQKEQQQLSQSQIVQS